MDRSAVLHLAQLSVAHAEQGPAPALLDAAWDPVFAAAPGLQGSRDWFAALAEAAMPPGACAATLLLRQGDAPAGLLPLQLGPDRRAASLTGPYTVLFQPLIDPAHAEAFGQAAGRSLRTHPVTVLEALDPGWPGLPGFLAGLRRAGLVPLRFEQFGNWHELVAHLDWPGYLAARPGALRETIRRRTRLADKDGTVRFETIRTPADLPAGLAVYEAVYARSWKEPEPYPAFTAALLTRLATTDRMRLGLMWQGDTPIAAQYWTVAGGTATVLKLAHDEAFKPLSPGTLLTAHMIRGLLAEGMAALDFGRGDDLYKRQWAAHRRQRIGMLLVNPRHPAGLAALARHAAGRLLRMIRR